MNEFTFPNVLFRNAATAAGGCCTADSNKPK